MAQFTDFDAYREAYFADPTANGPTAHPTGSAHGQQSLGQPSPQDADGFDVFLSNQSALADGPFDGLVSNSVGVSGTGYTPGAEDMRNLAHLGFGSELPSLHGLPHDPTTSQYAHMQNDIQTGRNRSWSASSRESTMSATGNGSATLFPAIPPNQSFSASPNISSIVLPESGTSLLVQGPYASHAEILQQQRSSPISSGPTQPKRMSTALRQRLAAVQQPQQSVPSLASNTRGQFAAPSMLLPLEPKQRKRRVQEPESDDPGLDALGQRSQRSARSGQSAKRQRRGSAQGVEEAQPVNQVRPRTMTSSTPFATHPFAPGFQLDAAAATGPYYASEFPLAPMPEQDDRALDAISAQQLLVQEPSPHHLPGSKTGSQRNLSVKMRQELARRKAARKAEREARHPASDDEIATPVAPFDTLFALEQHAVDPSAGQSSRFQMPTDEYSVNGPMDDWLERALSEGQHKMISTGGGDASADWYKQATNSDAMSGGSSSRWETGTITPGPNGQVFFDPRFAGDYDYDGNLDLHLDFVSVPLPSTPLEAEGSFGSHGGPSHTNTAVVPGFESSRCEHGMCSSSGCPSHATAPLHLQAFGDFNFAPSSGSVDNEGDGDDVPIAESSKAGAKRASTSRARGRNKKGPTKRGRKADAPAGGSAAANTPKSSGSRVQKANIYTPANPPRLPVHLPEIVQGHTPCPFCQHPIRTELKNSVLPSMCQVKEHLFGYNDNPPCPALAYWLVSWPKGGDLVGVAIIGEIIVRQWPDEVKGTDEEGWFPYRMWGKKTGFGGELLKWWNGLSQERKDEIPGKGKHE
ncbi:hypothetical protein EXIGLDRAFT_753995 [Exidia glandulosa HHB12029]|uniref:Uncharacterized protein n=1 Tax=Exidia glandulosa HHB12029 TaxID=1314781 RepID=A0A165DC51_EXIGL|nr:hypothetical protein EXIGLDRAFT_753995 [Exidia glandulosa HHB12029]